MLEQLSEIDRQRAFLRRHVDPGAVRGAGLQAGDAILRHNSPIATAGSARPGIAGTTAIAPGQSATQ